MNVSLRTVGASTRARTRTAAIRAAVERDTRSPPIDTAAKVKLSILSCHHNWTRHCSASFSGGSKIPRRRGANPPGGADIRFCKNFETNCMKLRKNSPPPLRSATGDQTLLSKDSVGFLGRTSTLDSD